MKIPVYVFTLLIITGCSSAQKEAPSLKMYVLDGGYIDLKDLLSFSQDSVYAGQRMVVEDPVFLIDHPKGRLIWDSGVPDTFADREEEPTSLFVGYIREKLIDQLASMNLTPDSIDYLALSHTHWDHAGNANYFTKSTWLVNEKEYEWVFQEEYPGRSTYVDSLQNSNKITFRDSYDVFGDSAVVVYAMPGHTIGHSVLLVRLKDTEPLLLTGDLYHFIEQREFKRTPRFNYDVDISQKSMEAFEKLAAKFNARVIIQHDKRHYVDLPKYPEYFE
jgi:glyoxylase-like metal-dependent hydrolase (beta-lactamase superfamily II)